MLTKGSAGDSCVDGVGTLGILRSREISRFFNLFLKLKHYHTESVSELPACALDKVLCKRVVGLWLLPSVLCNSTPCSIIGRGGSARSVTGTRLYLYFERIKRVRRLMTTIGQHTTPSSVARASPKMTMVTIPDDEVHQELELFLRSGPQRFVKEKDTSTGCTIADDVALSGRKGIVTVTMEVP